ncbi:MAG: menaquinone biosynthesis decarboxylase [Chloroflexota bacterium]
MPIFNIFIVYILAMSYSGLKSFITALEKNSELVRIKTPVNPSLEITEITDRIIKAGGKALLFENSGTEFPLLINTFGSDKRMALALGRQNPYDAGIELEKLFASLSSGSRGFMNKLSSIPGLYRISSVLPRRNSGRGACQQVIYKDPDLSILPVLKCWPHDGGPFITLPMVHTIHPETGSTNVGMYRMQVLDKATTGMHWQRHKTGANHFEAWKKTGKKMPVSVALGGDPVYTYASTAPLPENVNEYILAGFLRKKKVQLVKCLTNDLYVPYDADFILEGYVDPSEDMTWEGPFGDHTGFYSLADWYPRFHVTCITRRKDAVYPATIVGIPPQEDAFLAKATEKIFLSPVKMALSPEVTDFHMPDAGTAHNLVIVKIKKNYPGQGMKVISSLFGAGQMMFSKYIVVVSGDVDIRNYRQLVRHIAENFNPATDITFMRGPLDVLDHASDNFSFGGKAGLDATIKLPEENPSADPLNTVSGEITFKPGTISGLVAVNLQLLKENIPVLVVSFDCAKKPDFVTSVRELLKIYDPGNRLKMVLAVNHTVPVEDLFTVAWQVLANSDPLRDHEFINGSCLLIDGTIKYFRKGGFTRKWPNVVCSDEDTISLVDKKWESYGLGNFIESPSSKYISLLMNGKDEITG